MTYAGNTYPGGQLHQWRRRFHPIRDGLTQQYEVAFRVGRGESIPEAYPQAWRWAWQTLQPAVTTHDLAAARRNDRGCAGRQRRREGRARRHSELH